MTNEECGIFNTIEETFEFLTSRPNDERGRNSIKWIGHYLPILYDYAKMCDHVTEFGINQCISTWAFLKARPKKLVSVDKDLHKNPIKPCREDLHWTWTENKWLLSAIEIAKRDNINFEVIEANTLTCDIEPTDLLFIDTTHTYDHLYAELERHKNKVSRYIIFHDTKLFKTINTAIDQLLINTNEFKVVDVRTDDPGLTICERV